MNFDNLHESTLADLLENVSDVNYYTYFKTVPHYLKEDIKQFMIMKCLNTFHIGAYDPQYSVRNYFMSCCRNAGSVFIYHSNKLTVFYDISESQDEDLTTYDDEPLIYYSKPIHDVCKIYEPLYGDITSLVIQVFEFYGVPITIDHVSMYSDTFNDPPLNLIQRLAGLCVWNMIKDGE